MDFQRISIYKVLVEIWSNITERGNEQKKIFFENGNALVIDSWTESLVLLNIHRFRNFAKTAVGYGNNIHNSSEF